MSTLHKITEEGSASGMGDYKNKGSGSKIKMNNTELSYRKLGWNQAGKP